MPKAEQANQRLNVPFHRPDVAIGGIAVWAIQFQAMAIPIHFLAVCARKPFSRRGFFLNLKRNYHE